MTEVVLMYMFMAKIFKKLFLEVKLFWYRYEVSPEVIIWFVVTGEHSGSAAEGPHWRLTDKKCEEQAYLRDTAGSVPDHHNKASDTFFFFWFPSTYESYVYTILLSIKCNGLPLCLSW